MQEPTSALFRNYTKYIVDPTQNQGNGIFHKIQDAVDAVKDLTVIKIAPGNYSESINISKGNIHIEPL